MDNAGYVALSRQSGLMRELNTIANNLANISTTGYRREGSIFAEHVKALEAGGTSLSLATMSHRFVDFSGGDIKTTKNALDFSIDGEGFFIVATPGGERLTRDGAFSLNAQGEVVSANGNQILNEGGSAIVVPPEARDIAATQDGVIFADGQAIGKLAVVTSDPAKLTRIGDNLFDPGDEAVPVENPRVIQSTLEGSNVSPITEMARLIQVQRTYELSQKFANDESERIKRTVQTLGRTQ